MAMPPATPPIATPLYLTGEDGLRLTVLNAQAGVTVTLRGRFLPVPTDRDADPAISVFVHDLVPATDRSASTRTVALGEGWLLDASIIASVGAPPIGRCFAILSIVRGQVSSGLETSTLTQGYVSGTQRIGYPGSALSSSLDGGGALRSIVGQLQGAGADFFETVPTGARWELLALQVLLTTSVAAANRLPVLRVDDGANVYGLFPMAAFVTASAAANLTWAPGASIVSAAPLVAQAAPIGVGLKLLGGHHIRGLTNLLQGGDQYSTPIYLVREWIEGA